VRGPIRARGWGPVRRNCCCDSHFFRPGIIKQVAGSSSAETKTGISTQVMIEREPAAAAHEAPFLIHPGPGRLEETPRNVTPRIDPR
jgi:hypothetical protein